ncbi:histone-lysine N-methyltransferase SETMAR [Trichonephila clavipes]|nr:histone-lysine N-methyltransferase SETMAR [Trichonephila clavipes]
MQNFCVCWPLAVALRFVQTPSVDNPLLRKSQNSSALLSFLATFLRLPRFPQVVLRVGIELNSSKNDAVYCGNSVVTVNPQDTDTLLGRGLPQSSRWIRKKCLELLRSGILLLDDNSRPHSATAMQNHFATLSWERLHHSPCSPDLALSDFHLFPALKENLAGKGFGSNAEVKQTVKHFFRIRSPEFFQDGFLKLIKRYDKCLNLLGFYVEK